MAFQQGILCIMSILILIQFYSCEDEQYTIIFNDGMTNNTYKLLPNETLTIGEFLNKLFIVRSQK